MEALQAAEVALMGNTSAAQAKALQQAVDAA